MAGMTSSDFNSRINLQAFCDANGILDYTFLKLPRFGWFAINKRDGEIKTLTDFIPTEDMVKFCTDLIIEKPQYHESRILYNEISLARLVNDIRILLTLKQFHKATQQEFMEGQGYADGHYINISQMFTDNGMGQFSETGVGLITEHLLKSFSIPLALTKLNLKNKLIIPTWCSPQHLCSFEHCSIDTPNHRSTFFINGEKGWYGKVDKTVYGNFSNLLTHAGCTWDKKIDYWSSKVMDLDETSLGVSQCLQIWREANCTKFKRSPLDIIEANGGAGKLRLNTEQLTLAQIKELEKKFNIPLVEVWQKQKQAQVKIGNMTFIARDLRYYTENARGELSEFTNFMVEIHRIQKRDGKFYRQGIVCFEGKQEPFELANNLFLSTKEFIKALTHLFLTTGLGVPIVASNYRGYLLDVINRLNLNCMIDSTG